MFASARRQRVFSGSSADDYRSALFSHETKELRVASQLAATSVWQQSGQFLRQTPSAASLSPASLVDLWPGGHDSMPAAVG